MKQREIILENITKPDLDQIFEHMSDLESQKMAAFMPNYPFDRVAFDSHWRRILNDDSIIVKGIHYKDNLVGHIARYTSNGNPEITYWIGKSFWGKGIATKTLKKFLEEIRLRPIYARTAKHNKSSIGVLEKCGFIPIKKERGFSNVHNAKIEELLFKLD